LRLRDLAGLVVIDFIDMDEKRNNRAVERRLKECLRHDRARIQVGHISHFGLLEMSRQRIRSSVLESSTEKCPNCGGTGHVRSVSSVALQLLRAIEEMLLKSATHNLTVRTRADIALYLLNHKRAHLRGLEERFRISILVNADPSIAGQVSFLIEKGEQVHTVEQARPVAIAPPSSAESEQHEPDQDELDEGRPTEPLAAEEMIPLHATPFAEVAAEHENDEMTDERGPQQGQARKRRRRRRGRRGGEGERGAQPREGAILESGVQHSDQVAPEEQEEGERIDHAGDVEEPVRANGGGRGRRRRGRRGGREHRRDQSTKVQEPADLAHAGSDSELARTPPPLPAEIAAAETAYPMEERPVEPSRFEQEHPAEAALAKGGSVEHARRRSTVREPAMATSQDHSGAHSDESSKPTEPLEPVISSSTESQVSDRPPRSGWWSRRVFGRS
jgi:ribonuclease E